MQEVPLMVVVFGTLVLVIDQFRRLFVAISLNRSIREALKHHPESVPALLAQLERPSKLPLALGGWVFLGIAAMMGLMVSVAGDGPDREATVATIVIAGLGVALLVATGLVGRRSAKNQAAASSINSG